MYGENTRNSDGNRVKKTEAGETVLYVNKYYEKNLTTGNVTTSYYLGSQLVAQREGEEVRFIHQDHLSGTSLTTTDNGSVISSITYFPFGETRSGDVPTDVKFTGQKLDGTGLYYYNARYYDPVIGRFVSPDSVVPDGIKPQAFNRYSYCYNNPYKYVDVDGHFPAFIVGAIIGAVVNVTVQAAVALVTHTEVTWADMGRAAVEGAITGGLGVLIGPTAGTIAKAIVGTTGKIVGKAATVVASATLNAASGTLAYTAGEGIKAIETGSYDWNGIEASTMAVTNGVAGVGSSLILPTNGMSTLKQAKYFAPRTIKGFVNPGKNATAIELGTMFSTAFSSVSNEIVSVVYRSYVRTPDTNNNNSGGGVNNSTQSTNDYSYSTAYAEALLRIYSGY